jgi:hypothetical protein
MARFGSSVSSASRRSKKYFKITILFCVAFLFATMVSPRASAQVLYDGNNNLPPFGSYSGGDFDTVSLQNGNLHISIPVLTLPGRGKPLVYTFLYDTPDFTRTFNPPVPPLQHGTFIIAFDTLYTGWALRSSLDWDSQPQSAGYTVTCNGFSGSFQVQSYIVVDPQRSKHKMAVSSASSAPCQFG